MISLYSIQYLLRCPRGFHSPDSRWNLSVGKSRTKLNLHFLLLLLRKGTRPETKRSGHPPKWVNIVNVSPFPRANFNGSSFCCLRLFLEGLVEFSHLAILRLWQQPLHVFAALSGGAAWLGSLRLTGWWLLGEMIQFYVHILLNGLKPPSS